MYKVSHTNELINMKYSSMSTPSITFFKTDVADS